jgi:hypothetical protein
MMEVRQEQGAGDMIVEAFTGLRRTGLAVSVVLAGLAVVTRR